MQLYSEQYQQGPITWQQSQETDKRYLTRTLTAYALQAGTNPLLSPLPVSTRYSLNPMVDPRNPHQIVHITGDTCASRYATQIDVETQLRFPPKHKDHRDCYIPASTSSLYDDTTTLPDTQWRPKQQQQTSNESNYAANAKITNGALYSMQPEHTQMMFGNNTRP